MVIELIVFIETDGTVLATLELTFFGWWSNRLRVDGRNRCHSPTASPKLLRPFQYAARVLSA